MLRGLCLVVLLLAAAPGEADEAAIPELSCSLAAPAELPAGEAVHLRIGMHNGGTQSVEVLRWSTPWEGRWAAPFVAVSRDGVALGYGGRMVKRSRPQAEDWFVLVAGGTVTGEVDLSAVYDLSVPGSYQIAPRLRLLDVRIMGAGRRAPGEASSARPLDCPAAVIRVTPAAAASP